MPCAGSIFSSYPSHSCPPQLGSCHNPRHQLLFLFFLSDTENQELSFGLGNTCSLPMRGERNYSIKTNSKTPQEAWKNALLGPVDYFDFLYPYWMARKSVHHFACCPLCTNLVLDWHFCVKALLDSVIPIGVGCVFHLCCLNPCREIWPVMLFCSALVIREAA